MTLADTVLDLLRAYFPGFELDGEREPPRRHEPADKPVEEADKDRETDPVLARCYTDLGVPYGTDFAQVRRAWKRLVRLHHPDVQGEDHERRRKGTETVKKLNHAFEEIRRHRGSRGSA